MVNLKFIGLPLLVGLLSKLVVAEDVQKTCEFEIDTDYDKLKIKADEEGDSGKKYDCKKGYYVLDDTNKPVLSEGVKGKLYLCESIIADKKCSVSSKFIDNPVPGYYRYASETDKFLSCDNMNNCYYVGTPSKECSDSAAGELVKETITQPSQRKRDDVQANPTTVTEYHLCLGVFKNDKATLKFNTSGDYLVKKGSVFNFDSTTNYYVVKSEADKITFNAKYTRYDDRCANKSGQIISRFEDFCKSDESSGKYYTCMNGKCNSISQDNYTEDGPAIEEDKCEITVTKAPTEYDDDECAASSCNETNYGYHLGTDSDGMKYFVKYDGKCVIVKPEVGYYRHAVKNYKTESGKIMDSYNSVIQCRKTNNDVSCEIVHPSNELGQSCEGNPGKLIDTSFNTVLCLDFNNAQRFDGNAKVFVKGAAGSVLGTETSSYYAVNVTDDYMILKEHYDKSGVLIDGKRVNCYDIDSNNENKGKCKSTTCKFSITTSATTGDEKKYDYLAVSRECTDNDIGYYFVDVNGKSVYDENTEGLLFYYNKAGNTILITDKPGYYINQDKVTHEKYPNIVCKTVNNECPYEHPNCESANKKYIKMKCNLMSKPSTTCEVGKLMMYTENNEEKYGLCVNASDNLYIKYTDLESKAIESSGFDFVYESISYYSIVPNGYRIIIDKIDQVGYIDATSKNKNKLVMCGKSDNPNEFDVTCNPVNAKPFGYYLAKQGEEVIYCDQESKCFYEDVSGYHYNHYMIDAYNDGKVIKTNTIEDGENYYVDDGSASFNLIKCSDGRCSMVTGVGRGVYIFGKESQYLIVCDKSGCVKKNDLPTDGYYYLNGGYDKDTKPLITRIQKPTNLRKRTEPEYIWGTVTSGDKSAVYKNANYNSASLEKAIIYCSRATTCSEIDAEKGYYINIYGKELIECVEDTPATSSNTKCNDPVKIFNSPSNDQTNTYLINSSNNKLMSDNTVLGKLVECTYTKAISEGSDSEDCSLITSSYKNYYISTIDKKLIKYENSELIILNKNDVSTGYYINSNSDKYIACTNGADTTCIEEDVVEKCEGSIGKILKSEMKLCIKYVEGNNKVLESSGKYIVNVNTFAGSMSGNLLLNVDSKSITLVKPKQKEYYLVDNETNRMIASAGTEGTMYECTLSGVCTAKSETGIYTNSDLNSISNFQKITCADNKCKGTTKETGEVYCFHNSKLWTCNGNCDKVAETGTTCKEQIANDGYYALQFSSNEKIIKCTSNTCITETPKEGYYRNEDISKPLIKCENSVGLVRCNAIESGNVKDGYYVSSEVGKLISCKSKLCIKIDTVNDEGYYISGETGKVLIKCETSGVVTTCKYYGKPMKGYHLNADKDNVEGKKLIYCNINGSNYSCEERRIPNKGYFINAGNSECALLNCSKDNICKENICHPQNKYFVNGEDSQLIYCDVNNVCSSMAPEVNSWYLSSENNGSLIGCNSNRICKTYSKDELAKGYYINSDSNTLSYLPLLHRTDSVSEYATDIYKVEKGWYINADNNASNSNKIIKCSSKDSCTTAEVKTSKCSSSINGEFTNYYEEIKWCKDDKPIPLNNRVILFKLQGNNMVPGVVIPEGYRQGETYVILSIYNDSIQQNKIDGYFCEDDDCETLVSCKSDGYGVCSEVKDIKDGFYFNDVINNGIIKCEKGKCERDSYVDDCNGDKLMIRGRKMCIDSVKEHAIDIKKFDIERDYAIEKKDFPNVESRYIWVNINKYYVTIKEEIKEIDVCTKDDKKNKASDDKVCLLEDTQSNKYSLFNRKSQSVIKNNEVKEINSNYLISSIKYEADTNKGYFIYETGENKADLKKIFIPKEKDECSGDVGCKYECEIGGECVERSLIEETILGYGVTEDHILRKFIRDETDKSKRDENSKVVEEKIAPGYYIINGSSDGIILCYDGGECQKISNNKLDIGDTIKVKGTSPSVESDVFNKKYYLDGNKVYELSQVSYTELDGTRNIFIDNEYIMIGSENKNIAIGYSCINGYCKKITSVGNILYYLNTVQSGKKINAVVKCILNGVNTECNFINAEEGYVFENAAATGINDAIIRCTNEKCAVEKADSSVIGLPECKEGIDTNGNKVPEYIGNKYIRNDNSEELLDEQHCIFQGKIYKNGETDNVGNDKMMFDVTFRKINIGNIGEDHIGASLYDCLGGSCYITNGYIVNGVNYSKCLKKGCTYYNYNNVKEKDRKYTCETAGAGNIKYDKLDGYKIKLCLSDSDKDAVKLENNKYYPVDINYSDNFPEAISSDKLLLGNYVTEAVSVVTTTVTDNYVLLEKTNTIIESQKTANKDYKLYECNSETKNCVEVNKINDGNYKSYRTTDDSHIICLSNICGTYKRNNDLYIYRDFEPKRVKYKFSDGIIVKTSKNSVVSLKVDNYILLNEYEERLATENESVELNALYKCNAALGKCSSIKKPEDGWYVSGDSNYKAIKCESGSCEMIKDLGKNCSKEGDFVFNNEYYFCYYSTSVAGLKLSEKYGEKLYLSQSTQVFPNKKDYVAIYPDSVIGIGNIKSIGGYNKSLIKCTRVNTNECTTSKGVLEKGKYCISGTSIYSFDGTKCNQMFKEKNEVNLFNVDELIVGTNTTLTGYIGKGTEMYHCSKGGVCRLATGYKIYNSNVYECKYDGCEKVNENSEVKGKMSGTYLITDKGKVPAPTTTNTYYYISGSNNFPGSENLSSILVEAGSGYFVLFKGDGYYLTGSGNTLSSEEPVKDNKLKRGVDSNLYLCDKTSGKCVREENIYNGYYINGAAESSGKAIVGCKSGICVVDENIKENCSKVGDVIRQANANTYRLCTTKTNSVEIKSNNNKHYLLSLGRNDTFAGISIPDDEKYNNAKVSILVKLTGQYVNQYTKEGYVIFSNNDIVENVKGSGSLYKCENANYPLETNSDQTVQCNPVVNVNNGWYFNNIYGDKRYIRCAESSCSIVEATESRICKESGSLIYNNGRFKLCETVEKQVDIKSTGEGYEIIMNVSNMNEFPGVRANNVNIITYISEDSVISLNKLETYLAVNEDNTIITSSGDNELSQKGYLYKCTAMGGCVIDTIPNDEWYIKTNNTGAPVELIYCSNTKCQLMDETQVDKKKGGFRVSANKDLPLIQCITPGKSYVDKFDQSDKVTCVEKNYKEGWYPAAGSTSKMVKCDKEYGCWEETGIYNGWYINNAANSMYSYGSLSNATVYPIIKCDNGNCESYTQEISKQQCTKAGELVFTGGKYKLCYTDKNNSLKSEDFSGATSETKLILSIATGGDFPGASTGLIIVKITNHEVQLYKNEGYYYKDNIMYKCENDGTCKKEERDGITVKNELVGDLMTSNCKDDNCNWISYGKEGIAFLDSESKMITEEGIKTVNKIYRCKKDDSKVLKCNEESDYGYYYNNDVKDKLGNTKPVLYKYDGNWEIIDETNIKKCSPLGYKDNYCYVGYNDEPYYGEGSVEVPAGDLCITEKGKYYLAINKINTGIDEPNCVIMPNDGNTYYYQINYSRRYSIDKYSATREYNQFVNSLNNTLVINNSGNENYDRIMRNGNQLNRYTITCKDKVCVTDKSAICSYDFQEEKCKLESGNVNAGETCISKSGNMYLALERLSIGAQGKCVQYRSYRYAYENKNVTADYGSYIYKIINKDLYRFTGYEVIKEKDGIYLINDADELVRNVLLNEDEIVDSVVSKEVDITEKSTIKLYICNKDGCNVKNSCGIEGRVEYMYDQRREMVMKCDPETNTVSYIEKEGYYVNSPWNNLIKCYSDGNCKVFNEEEGMEGYYLDAGNENSIIKCIRDGDEFKCNEEKIISCVYDNKEKTCHSEVDLLRNSYCYYSAVDKQSGTINKLIYIENFIKAGDDGNCKENTGNTDYFFKYKKSKFLGHEERNDLIKFSKDSIVSVYEKDVGYYIISTETGKGVEEDTYLKKTRMYECKQQSCNEVLKPENKKIYINKASVEKLIRYKEEDKYEKNDKKNKKWEVIKHRCDVNVNNKYQCKLYDEINVGDILYTIINDSIKLYTSKLYISKEVKSTANDYHNRLHMNKYQYINDEMFITKEHTLDWVNEKGYYVFRYNYGEKFNLIPYKSTENITLSNVVTVYKKDESWTPERDASEFSEAGFYWNKADLENEGIIIQSMDVPNKEKPDDTNKQRRDNNVSIGKIKNVINKCTSVKKNVCINAQDGQTIPKGSACVVVDGEFRGLYLATGPISKTSTNNCMKFDEGITYSYIGSRIEFAGEPLEKNILKVDENVIVPFKKTDIGYYMFDENKKPFNSTTVTTLVNNAGGAYKCSEVLKKDEKGEDIQGTETYECNTFSGTGGYLYGNVNLNVNSNIYYGGSNKWNKEEKSGYYFFNKNDLPATISKVNNDDVPDDTVYDRRGNAGQTGKYINSAESKQLIIISSTGDNSYSIVNEKKQCVIEKDICKGANGATLVQMDTCYIGSGKDAKLYVVEVTKPEKEDEVSKTMCYTGSEKIVKYRLIDHTLYRLDGLSVQEMNKGIFVLNKNWEQFSSENPETPENIVVCEDYSNCSLATEAITVDADVVINAAGTGVNRLLKYYSSVNKYVDINQPGYYFFNKDGGVTINTSDMLEYEILYELKENGELIQLDKKDIKLNNIYINYAKEGALTYGLKDVSDNKLGYNSVLDMVSYDNSVNEDAGKNVFIYIGEKLFKQLPKEFDEVEEGLYAIKNNRPLTSTTWKTLYDSSKEICYYDKSGCSSVDLNNYKNQKYIINKASEKPSIIERNEDDEWRMVDNDGYYFFFEDGYSINNVDTRVSIVLQVVNGDVNEITEGNEKSGFYLFNNLMIENTLGKWEDGEDIVSNVVSDKKKCKSYEIEELIESQEFCYDSSRGICIPTGEITDKLSDDDNCIFSEEDEMYYYIIKNNLYAVNNKGYSRISKSGVYVVDSYNRIYDSKKEKVAKTFVCSGEECSINNKLGTKYFMNMANDDTEKPTIVYHKKSSGTWKKTSENGYYFFNVNGEPVKNGEDIAYAYSVGNNGNTIENIIDKADNGKYASQSDPNKAIIAEMKDGVWQKAVSVAKCTIDNDTMMVTSDETLSNGDICMDNKKLVLIKPDSSKAKRDEDYEGIMTVNGILYYYVAEEKHIMKVDNNKVSIVNVNGYAIIDRETMKPLDSIEEVEADIYKCSGEECEIVSTDSVSGGRYVNALSEKLPLVRNVEGDNWVVESDEGYYFLNSKQEAVGANDFVSYAFEVDEVNGVLVQTDVSKSKDAGFFVNKAGDGKVIVNNNGVYWNNGETIRTCNVTNIEEGTLCKTYKENEIYEGGSYCYAKNGNRMYLLTANADFKIETANCVTAQDEGTIYLAAKNAGEKINGVDIDKKLVKLDGENIEFAKPGYYTLNEKGIVIDNNEGEGVELTIYNCNEEECNIVIVNAGTRILSTSGDIFEIDDETDKLIKVNNEGLYFFDAQGNPCNGKNGDVATIIKINSEGEKFNVPLNELNTGSYVNEASNDSVTKYNGKVWTSANVECSYDEKTSSCNSDENVFEVGDYCVNNGKLYVIYGEDEESNTKYCVGGNDDKPIYLKNKESQLMVVKEKEIKIVDVEGYYAIDSVSKNSLESEDLVSSQFIKCEYDGECEDVKPVIGSYLNRAPPAKNIVQFPTGEISKAMTIEKQCDVNNEGGVSICSVDGGEIAAGDLCVASTGLYLVGEDSGECVSAEKTVDTYKLVNNKLYKLNDDSVVQLVDGYYFINKNGRAIDRREDYAKAGTVGYICSKKGDCVEIEPEEGRYYIDYTTMEDNRYVVLKGAGSAGLRKRDDEGGDNEGNEEGNGADGEGVGEDTEEGEEGQEEDEGDGKYENIEEPGVYKLDDGSYTECEKDNNDQITCHDIEEEGTKQTNDGELVNCVENEDGEIECSQATEGGYYVIDDKLMSCKPNETEDQLECEEMDKEGYFLAKPGDVLYECVEKEEEEQEDETNNDNENVSRSKRQLVEIGKEEDDEEEEYNVNINDVNGSDSEEESSSGAPSDEPSESSKPEEEGPKEVTCSPVECSDEPIKNGDVELYVCTNVAKEGEEAEYKWTPSAEEKCESGSYIKRSDDVYECEDEKPGIDPETIEKPNTEHTTSSSPKATTTAQQEQTTTTTTAAQTKTTTTASTTKATTTVAPSGASSLFHKLPSVTLYIILFVFAFLIQY